MLYEERPPKKLPYTMAMIGGDWTHTNLEMPAGGVAPIAECGALGQRHVVYADDGWGRSASRTSSARKPGTAGGSTTA